MSLSTPFPHQDIPSLSSILPSALEADLKGLLVLVSLPSGFRLVWASWERPQQETGGREVRSWCLFLAPSLGDGLRLAASLTEVHSRSSGPLLPPQTMWGEESAGFISQ